MKIFLFANIFFWSFFSIAKLKEDQPQKASVSESLASSAIIPFETYQLKNGLKVILSRSTKTPMVHVSLWYEVGALDEKYGKTGLAHLFEHLAFEGTRHYKPDEHFKLLEKFGRGINASTGFSYTNYYEEVPKEQLELVLSLESSRAHALVFSEEKRKEQLAVVRREREVRYETSPYLQGFLTSWEAIFYKNNPFYGYVIGSHEDLENAKLKDLEEFYYTHYIPANATLALSGNFEVEDAKKLINKYFASIPAQEKKPRAKIVKTVIEKERVIHYQEPFGKVPLVNIRYITPAAVEEGDPACDVIAHILTGGNFSRLTKLLKVNEKLVSYISSYQNSMEIQSIFNITAMPSDKVSPEEVLEKIDQVIEGFAKNPPTEKEVQRAKDYLITEALFALQTISSRGQMLQRYNIFAKDPGFLPKDVQRYLKLTPQDISEAIKKYLPVGEKRVILIADPNNKSRVI